MPLTEKELMGRDAKRNIGEELLASILELKATPLAHTSVGASLLAMDVNDNACFLYERVALETIASKLAPT
ncbi:hypothetical protein PS914_03756 [Pseudomonas fluorescens]|uniref:Uncharacterized protein n=1 Tax=Pseudomonas fluorescens TaxID=294 RepID=A0A5E7C874_PSEFL|nr:hypothetical protein [Pseudomonas fluorescens]VVO00949.1 hypothetical protein PS833_02638 [Pseudomonas fluorescens]VVP97823.1 hypothetical protein PS914_03756 [Pseudomonas fluorescens]